jgi:hypothetical protein
MLSGSEASVETITSVVASDASLPLSMTHKGTFFTA